MQPTILHIDSSVGGTASASRQHSQTVVDNRNPATVIRRDLTSDPLPYIDGLWADTRLKPQSELTEADKEVLALSADHNFIRGLQFSDQIVGEG